MIIVGLTGGIGSGKTTVANFFKELNVPVYIADEQAKRLMNTSKVLRRKIIKLFGDEAYENDELNRSYIASKIFRDKSLLEQMNAIVHPKVRKHFSRWLTKQDKPYIIKEAAILFEIDSSKEYDFIITVIADEDIRVDRIMKRDNTSRQKIKAIMDNQWEDSIKKELSDFVIENNTLEDTKKQVLAIHKKLLKLSQKT